MFLHVSGPWTNLPEMTKMGPGGFFLLIQTLPTFRTERSVILIIFMDAIFFRFPGTRFPNFQKSGLGQAWALGRAWALRLGRVGPSGGLGGPRVVSVGFAFRPPSHFQWATAADLHFEISSPCVCVFHLANVIFSQRRIDVLQEG